MCFEYKIDYFVYSLFGVHNMRKQQVVSTFVKSSQSLLVKSNRNTLLKQIYISTCAIRIYLLFLCVNLMIGYVVHSV